MTRLRRVAAILAVAVLLAAVPGAAHAEKTIGLSSGSFAFTVDAGGTGQGEVVVGNDGDEPLKALVYVTDVEVDSAGQQTYIAPQREGASLMSTPASWFRIYMPEDSKSVGNTPYVELAPGQSVPIKFEFTPPAGTAPGDHNVVIFFEMFEYVEGTEGSTAQVAGRLGTRIALRVSGQIREQVVIRPFEVPSFVIGRVAPYSFTVNNQGNVNERLQIVARLLDGNESTLWESVVATDAAVYADSGRQFTGEIMAPGTRIGPHVVEVVATFTEDGAQLPTEVVEQRRVWLIPLWLVVLLGFVVVYGGGYLLITSRRKRERRRGSTPRLGVRRARDTEAAERRHRREERAAE